jgi:predicted TIM-barrel fold metal-dependent hydrolase
MEPVLEIKSVDRQFYQTHLAGFLPHQVIDLHTHVWLKEFRAPAAPDSRGPTWPRRVAAESPIEELLETYRLLLPEQQVTPLVFGWPARDADMEQTNAYTCRVARENRLSALMVTTPAWSASELERRVVSGSFVGLKPYVDQAPLDIPTRDITIYDYMPHHQLQVADAHRWIVMLHIPRAGRLNDPLNVQQLMEIDGRYPNLQLVVAHVGRAYCPEDVGTAFDVLRTSRRMTFDFSANTSACVMEQALRAVGPRRMVFGSDLPIVRMRMRRICEAGSYVNLVPPGLYGPIGDDPHMREVGPEEGERLTFFLYEQLLAFRRAAEACGLTAGEVADVFYGNAARLIAGVSAPGGTQPSERR